MKLLVGLGNPGEKYQKNRHNIGFLFVDYFANANDDSFTIQNLRILKPQHFMNKSGSDVAREMSFYKIPIGDLVVVHDDLDIALGEFKIQKSKGPKVHNGVNDIEAKIGSKDFWRVRVGVDNRAKENRIPGDAYVLQNFSESEFDTVVKLFPEILREVSKLLQ